MPRVILVSGKGGVGKTTVAAATASAIAARGRKTLVLSFDLAHSLRDSFGVTDSLISRERGQPVEVSKDLEFQEIDICDELERDWEPVYRYVSGLMSHGGLDGALADELAVVPGMEDIAALITLHRYLASNRYDAIVLDCPPTGSTLRFIGLASGLQWYARKRLRKERSIVRVVRPLAQMIHESALYLPEDSFFGALESIVERLESVEQVLRNPAISTLRLVTNPEKMVFRETQRAYMYFGMYGMHVDMVMVNRLFPAENSYFSEWAAAQAACLDDIEKAFPNVPVARIPLFPEEVTGRDALARFAEVLYPNKDPEALFAEGEPVRIIADRHGEQCRIEVAMPFVEKDQVDITRNGQDLVLRVGTFKRHMQLPATMAEFQTAGAELTDGKLTVRFERCPA